MPAATHKPSPKDVSNHFSRVTKHRVPSQVKRFYQYFAIPGIGNLAGGLPNPSYFPYDTLEASTAVPDRFKPTPNDPVDPPTTGLNLSNLNLSGPATASRVLVPHDSAEPNLLRKIDLTTALQYGTAQGYPPLYSFIREFVRKHLHPNVPYDGGAEVILTVGSTDGFAKAIEAFSNIWDSERDWIREREGLLCEEFAYMNAIQTARPRGLNVVPVAIDDEGMLAYGKGGLQDVLSNWDTNKGKRPHLMYTVTMGQNPTSGLLSLARRKEIYALAQKYDIIIVEDDPYWYLQYPSALGLSNQARGHQARPQSPVAVNYNTLDGGRSSGYDFLDSLVPSYLSIDVDGRVVRLDTFSKTVAPGCRLGWITAQPAVIEKIQLITESSTQQPSGFVQSLIAELLMGPSSHGDAGKGGSKDGSGWKFDGWVRWLEGLRGNYERRMQVMSQILEDGKYLIQGGSTARSTTAGRAEEDDFEIVNKTQLYDFVWPAAGMFLWLRAHFDTHPLYKKLGGQRLASALWIFLTSKPYLVLLAPGAMFSPTPEIAEEVGWQYYRLCFAAVDDDLVAKHSKGTVDAFVDFWAIENSKTIDDLLDDPAAGAATVEHASRQQASFATNPIFC